MKLKNLYETLPLLAGEVLDAVKGLSIETYPTITWKHTLGFDLKFIQ